MKKIQEHLGLVFLIIIAIFAAQSVDILRCEKAFLLGMIFITKSVADKFVHNTVNYVERTKDDTFYLWQMEKQNVSIP